MFVLDDSSHTGPLPTKIEQAQYNELRRRDSSTQLSGNSGAIQQHGGIPLVGRGEAALQRRMPHLHQRQSSNNDVELRRYSNQQQRQPTPTPQEKLKELQHRYAMSKLHQDKLAGSDRDAKKKRLSMPRFNRPKKRRSISTKKGEKRARISSETSSPPSSFEADVWMYLLLSTLVTIASLATLSLDTSSSSFNSGNTSFFDRLYAPQRNSSITTASLCLLGIQIAVCLVMGVGLRINKLKHWLVGTSSTSANTSISNDKSRMQSKEEVSASTTRKAPSAILTTLSFLLQLTANSLLLDGSNYIATIGTSISNPNLFFGCWISWWLVVLLVGRLVGRGLLLDDYSSSSTTTRQSRVDDGSSNKPVALWTSSLLLNVTILSTSINLVNSPICHGLMSNMGVCSGARVALTLGALNCGVGCLMLLVLYVSSVQQYHLRVNGSGYGGSLFWNGKRVHNLGFIVSILSFVLQAASIGVITSPGGIGSNSGNLFVALWSSVFWGLFLLIRYADAATILYGDTSEEVVGKWSINPVKYKKVLTPRGESAIVIGTSVDEDESTDSKDDEESMNDLLELHPMTTHSIGTSASGSIPMSMEEYSAEVTNAHTASAEWSSHQHRRLESPTPQRQQRIQHRQVTPPPQDAPEEREAMRSGFFMEETSFVGSLDRSSKREGKGGLSQSFQPSSDTSSYHIQDTKYHHSDDDVARNEANGTKTSRKSSRYSDNGAGQSKAASTVSRQSSRKSTTNSRSRSRGSSSGIRSSGAKKKRQEQQRSTQTENIPRKPSQHSSHFSSSISTPPSSNNSGDEEDEKNQRRRYSDNKPRSSKSNQNQQRAHSSFSSNRRKSREGTDFNRSSKVFEDTVPARGTAPMESVRTLTESDSTISDPTFDGGSIATETISPLPPKTEERRQRPPSRNSGSHNNSLIRIKGKGDTDNDVDAIVAAAIAAASTKVLKSRTSSLPPVISDVYPPSSAQFMEWLQSDQDVQIEGEFSGGSASLATRSNSEHFDC